jgi:hypothetical protein
MSKTNPHTGTHPSTEEQDRAAGGRKFRLVRGTNRRLINFEIRVIAVDSRLDELTIYLNMNSGGTPHSQEELSRVAAMIELERNSKGA